MRQIGQAVKESRSLDQAIQVYRDFKRLRKGKITYRVVSRLLGKHQYRRKDLQEAFVRAINERYARTLPQVEEDADLEIWVNLLGSDLLCGLRLSDESMRHRAYQAVHLPASLRPSAAAAMVLLTEPGADDVFIDPMCGSGTLLIERAYAGPSRWALGGDIAPRHARATATNLAAVAPETAVHVWDARRLPLRSASVDRLATNLPFGKQIASREEVERLYPPFFAEMERILKPGGKAVVLSSEYELVKEAVRACPRLHIATGYSVAVLGQWGRIYVIDREKNR